MLHNGHSWVHILEMRHCSFTGREINLELFNIFQIFDNLSLVDSIDVNIVSKAIRKEQ